VFLDVHTGHALHPGALTKGSVSDPDLAGGISIVSDDGHVQAVDGAGTVVWSRSVPVSSRLSFTVVNGRVFIPYQGPGAYAGCGD
jgi:outer membrane protein assembly factor BamB